MNIKSEPEEKKPTVSEERKYAVISRDSVKLFAESAGYSELTDEAASVLAEDVSYKIREAAQNCSQYMKHARRRKLTSEDFSKALKASDVEPVYGHGSGDPLVFQQSKDSDIHFTEDVNISLTNLAQRPFVLHKPPPPIVKGHWLSVEGNSKISQPLSTGKQPLVTGKLPDINTQQKLVSKDLLEYYEGVTKTLLDSDDELLKIALNDLRTNNRISPLIPHFISFIVNGVKTVNYDISKLMKLMHTVHSLVRNPSLYLEPQPYLTLISQAVQYCLLEPFPACTSPPGDHWLLRDYAAFLLADITRTCNSFANKLHKQVEHALSATLCDEERPLCSYYGAVKGLTMLGHQAVEKVILPQLPTCLHQLEIIIEDNSVTNAQQKSDAHKVYCVLQLAAAYLLKNYVLELSDHSDGRIAHKTAQDVKDYSKIYTQVYSYFGDSLSIYSPTVDIKSHTYVNKKTKVLLGDKNSMRTGEELLEQFLQASEVPETVEKNRDDEDIGESESRSEHSEEMSYSEDVAVVKRTVNDPEGGIKLTISMKRPGSSSSTEKEIKHKKTKLFQHQYVRESAGFDLPLIHRQKIRFVGPSLRNRSAKIKNLGPYSNELKEIGLFRKLCFKKSIIGKRTEGKQSKLYRGIGDVKNLFL